MFAPTSRPGRFFAVPGRVWQAMLTAGDTLRRRLFPVRVSEDQLAARIVAITALMSARVRADEEARAEGMRDRANPREAALSPVAPSRSDEPGVLHPPEVWEPDPPVLAGRRRTARHRLPLVDRGAGRFATAVSAIELTSQDVVQSYRTRLFLQRGGRFDLRIDHQKMISEVGVSEAVLRAQFFQAIDSGGAALRPQRALIVARFIDEMMEQDWLRLSPAERSQFPVAESPTAP